MEILLAAQEIFRF